MSPLPYRWIMVALLPIATACGNSTPQPFGPVPTESQLAWQRMEINMFCHFGPNTFTGKEWGTGQEVETVFNPKALDCSQWVEVAEMSGIKGIILTAKHHDGFCLWPSIYSTHTIAQSSWNEGHGDVLREFVDACRGRVKAGVYISPWDRNHPDYGTLKYNAVFSNTLREVHEMYGPFFEQWFDGACGEGPNGKRQEYDWPLFENTVFEVNPQCVIFSDVGPGCRWVGNEEGRADETNWSVLRVENGERRTDSGGCGNIDGDRWIPSEVDVSIRPGWFWHSNEHPKTVDELMEIYYNSIGRNGLLLLNVPPDTNGRIASEDSAVLVAFRAERDRIFSRDLMQGATLHATSQFNCKTHVCNLLDTSYNTYWAASDDTASVSVTWDEDQLFDLVVLQEYIPLGQRVSHFKILSDSKLLAEGTTVGYKRIVRLQQPIATRMLTITFTGRAAPIINRIALYNSKAK